MLSEILLEAFIALAIGLLLLVWSTHFRPHYAVVSEMDRKVSQFMLWVYFLSRSVNFQIRTDLNALVTQGLTLQNKMQMVVVLIAGAWSGVLLVRNRVPIASLLAGPGFWVSTCVVVFLLSAFWSVWPALTIYRSIEFGAIWIICVHVFAQRNWYEQVHTFLWSILSVYWLSGITGILLRGVNQDAILGIFRSNGGSALAAAVIIWSIHRASRFGWSRHGWMLIPATLSLFVFGSLTSTLALMGGLSVYLLLSARSTIRTIMVCGLVATVLGILTSVYFIAGDLSVLASAGIDGISTLFDRSPAALRNATGRTKLWAAMWEVSKDNPLGLGYAAAERLFSADGRLAGWAPGPGGAHNGYLSGLFGAGWIGASMVILIFVATWMRIRHADEIVIPVTASMLFIMAINNLSLPIVGGSIGLASLSVFMLVLVARKPKPDNRHEYGVQSAYPSHS